MKVNNLFFHIFEQKVQFNLKAITLFLNISSKRDESERSLIQWAYCYMSV